MRNHSNSYVSYSIMKDQIVYQIKGLYANRYKFITSMQVSVQTDRKKKAELAPLNNITPLPEVQEEDQKQRERKIKKLTLINRELIETLKRQNQELTKKISKQKMKVGRSVERAESPGKNLQKEKKQLANAYKQIEMYKSVLKDLKAKQISTQSADKLNQLENKIKYQDMTIQKLQKQLKYVKNIKEQQQKQLHLYSNQDVKLSVGELQQQLKQLKQKLKQSKKQNKKRQQVSLKQHSYFIQLQKTLRKQNNEYYPGVTTMTANKREPSISNSGEDITERQWQVIRSQLAELKKVHEESNKKIETLSRLRNKEIKSFEDNELRLKEKQRKLQILKTKMMELAKLVGSEKDQRPQRQRKENNSVIAEEQGEYQGVIQNGKKVFKAKNPQNEREVKRWIIPQGYVQQKGKILSDSTFFSDKMQLRSSKKSKIIKIHIWTDSAGFPAVCQFFYLSQQSKIIAGIIPFTTGELAELEDKFIQYKQGDYLAKINGKINDGIITSLTFVSKFGKKQLFNPSGQGEDWKFQPRPNEIPTCMFGSLVKDGADKIKMCYIGCQFIEDW